MFVETVRIQKDKRSMVVNKSDFERWQEQGWELYVEEAKQPEKKTQLPEGPKVETPAAGTEKPEKAEKPAKDK